MDDALDNFEQAAQIAEAFAEAEMNDHVLGLLGRIANPISDHTIGG